MSVILVNGESLGSGELEATSFVADRLSFSFLMTYRYGRFWIAKVQKNVKVETKAKSHSCW